MSNENDPVFEKLKEAYLEAISSKEDLNKTLKMINSGVDRLISRIKELEKENAILRNKLKKAEDERDTYYSIIPPT